MTALFTVDFENNKLYDPGAKGFDFIACSGGTMEVTAGSKYEGTYGCEISPLVNYRCAGAKRVNSLTRFRQAFYFHPHGITIPTTKYFTLAREYHNDTTIVIYTIYLVYTTALGYQIEIGIADNTGLLTTYSADYVLPSQNDWNLIETDWYAGAGGTGFFSLWIDGTFKRTLNATNDALRIMYPSIGGYYASGTISGSYYMDYWRANDTGDVIGA